MAEADVKLTTVSKGGAKLGSVIPQEAMSKSDGKVLLPGNFLGVGEFKTVAFEGMAKKSLEQSTYWHMQINWHRFSDGVWIWI